MGSVHGTVILRRSPALGKGRRRRICGYEWALWIAGRRSFVPRDAGLRMTTRGLR